MKPTTTKKPITCYRCGSPMIIQQATDSYFKEYYCPVCTYRGFIKHLNKKHNLIK